MSEPDLFAARRRSPVGAIGGVASARDRVPLRVVHSFDGLRGYAAVGIVVYHCQLRPGTDPILQHLSVGVDLFFVLSGFVMALTYRSLFAERVTAAAVRVFLGRRLARVYPLYALVTVAIAVLVATGHSARAPRDALPLLAPANLLMVQTWFGLSSLDFPAWSVSTEWGAYLAFPLLAPLLLRPSAARCRVGAAACAVIALAVVYLSPRLSPVTAGRGGDADLAAGLGALAQCLGDFTLGMLAFVVAEHPFGRALARVPAASLLLGAAIVRLALLPLRPVLLLALVLVFPPLLIACSADRGTLPRLLAGRVGRSLGAWSYAIYLLHPGLLGVDAKLQAASARAGLPAPAALATAGTIAIVLPLAALVFHGLERPMRRLVRARIDRGAVAAREAQGV